MRGAPRLLSLLMLCALPAGAKDAGVDAGKVGAGTVDAAKVGAGKVDAAKVGAAKVDAGKVGPTLAELGELSAKEWRELIASKSREELEQALPTISPETLLSLGRKTAAALGVYALKLTKEERVRGEWVGPQVLDVVVRESPRMIRVDYVEGPGKGRRLLYNEKLRAKELRARDAGLFSLAGAVWVGLDSSFTRRDTQHPITDLCYGAVYSLLEGDLKKARPFGGHQRTDKGFDTSGHYCIEFVMPAAVKDPYARKALLCTDLSRALLTHVEVWDDQGRLEKLKLELKGSQKKVAEDFFTPEVAGL